MATFPAPATSLLEGRFERRIPMPNWKGIVGRGFRSQEFQDYVSTLIFSDWRPQFVVVHNTAAPKLSQWHSTPGEQRMKNLEGYYKNQQKWSAGPRISSSQMLSFGSLRR